MNYTVDLTDEALEDYDEASAYYEQQKMGLGFDFSFRLTETLEMIENAPSIHPSVEGNVRYAHLKQFPYKVFFEFEKNQPEVMVFAILHDKRHPDYWRKRREGY